VDMGNAAGASAATAAAGPRPNGTGTGRVERSGTKRSSGSRLYMETALEHKAADCGMGNGLRLWTPRKTGGIKAWVWTTRRFIGEGVGLVDSAREENKARAVV